MQSAPLSLLLVRRVESVEYESFYQEWSSLGCTKCGGPPVVPQFKKLFPVGPEPLHVALGCFRDFWMYIIARTCMKDVDIIVRYCKYISMQ